MSAVALAKVEDSRYRFQVGIDIRNKGAIEAFTFGKKLIEHEKNCTLNSHLFTL